MTALPFIVVVCKVIQERGRDSIASALLLGAAGVAAAGSAEAGCRAGVWVFGLAMRWNGFQIFPQVRKGQITIILAV
jgi:hypothetical protein